MRYSPLKSVKFSEIRLPITRFRIILPTLTVKNLYKKFHDKERKENLVQIGLSAIKLACDPVKPRTWCFLATSGHFRKAPRLHFSSWQKTSAQRLMIQQQRHMTATFFASPRAIVYDWRRRHSRRPEACC